MIRVGIAGVGFMGWIHFLAYQRVEGAALAAVCSRDEKKRRGDWRGIKGNFGPPGEQVDLSGVSAHETLDELLADERIDLVDLCLPPHLHVEAATKSLQAGKHVLCEKPLALTAEDCDKLVAVASQAGRRLLVGHVLPFFPEYAKALEIINSGEHGRPLGGRFKRVISDPTWLADFYDPARVGGPLIDLHVHDAHFIRLVFGMPRSVRSRGRQRGGVVEYCETQFGFADRDVVVSAAGGVIQQQGRPFTHAFEIHLERATLHYDFAAFADRAETMPLKVLTSDGQVVRPDLGGGDEITAFAAEINEAASAIESGRADTILSADLARDAIVLCQRQAESVKRAETVSVAAPGER